MKSYQILFFVLLFTILPAYSHGAFIRINCPAGSIEGQWLEVSGDRCWQEGVETPSGIKIGVTCVGGGRVLTRYCSQPARCPNFLNGCGNDNSWAEGKDDYNNFNNGRDWDK